MTKQHTKQNRREFLSRTSFTLAAAGMAGLPHSAAAAQSSAGTSPPGRLIQRTLGRTGLQVPIVNMGVMNANNPELLKQAYDAGVRLFDTAEGYQQGRNERMIGEAFSRLGVRDKVIIQTKVRCPRGSSGNTKSALLASVAGCLERLQTSYVDILLVHAPAVEQMSDPDVVAALKELKQQKKARFVGVSQHSNQAAALRSAAESGIYDVALVGFNLTNANDEDFLAAIKAASARGVGLIAMKTQTGGRGKNLGELNHTALLKWVMRQTEFATSVPGFTNADQLKQSFSVAYGIDYTADEKSWLADKNVQLALDFCKQCGSCVPTCPRGVEIPTLMRAHMYAANYANFDQARATFDEIPAAASLGNCSACDDCSARCANRVRIGERLADLRTMYA